MFVQQKSLMPFIKIANMDYIILKNLEFFGRHGVYNEEKLHPQKFITTVKLYLDLKEAGKSDQLSHTINYSDVYNILKEIFEQHSFNLIESLAQTSANTLLKRYPKLSHVKISVKKTDIPGKGPFDYFGVNITTKRP